MKKTLIFLTLVSCLFIANSCKQKENNSKSVELNMANLVGFWQNDSGAGYNFKEDGTYEFYSVESDVWTPALDSLHIFVIAGNDIICSWFEGESMNTLTLAVDSFNGKTISWHLSGVEKTDMVFNKVDRK